MGVIILRDFKMVHIKRDFTSNVFLLRRFHCITECDTIGSTATPRSSGVTLEGNTWCYKYARIAVLLTVAHCVYDRICMSPSTKARPPKVRDPKQVSY